MTMNIPFIRFLSFWRFTCKQFPSKTWRAQRVVTNTKPFPRKWVDWEGAGLTGHINHPIRISHCPWPTSSIPDRNTDTTQCSEMTKMVSTLAFSLLYAHKWYMEPAGKVLVPLFPPPRTPRRLEMPNTSQTVVILTSSIADWKYIQAASAWKLGEMRWIQNALSFACLSADSKFTPSPLQNPI